MTTTQVSAVDRSNRGEETSPAGATRHWRLSLPWRVFVGNSIVLCIAIVVLAFTPATVTVPTRLDEAVVFVGGLTAILLTNVALLRHAFAPLRRLTRMMSEVQPLEPGTRIPVYGDDAEVVELTRAFNEMLERLEDERRDSAHRSIEAQEGERRHVAQELHDEIGQTLTAIVLQLDRLARQAPPELKAELENTRESARESLEDARRIAQRLRPETLEDLGLSNALQALCGRVAEHSEIRVETVVDVHGTMLPPDSELVIYRIAQEALTNVLRHAGAAHVVVELGRTGDEVVLRVADDGVGLDRDANQGSGLQGMRERALLVDGKVSVAAMGGGGTEVALHVPIEAGR